jgi:hypothetical protein
MYQEDIKDDNKFVPIGIVRALTNSIPGTNIKAEKEKTFSQ